MDRNTKKCRLARIYASTHTGSLEPNWLCLSSLRLKHGPWHGFHRFDSRTRTQQASTVLSHTSTAVLPGSPVPV